MTTTYADKAHFGNYNPASFGWGGANDPKTHPKLLVPFTFAGAYFGLMHRDAVPVFAALLTELVPKIPGGIGTKKDEGCYNPASVTVGGSRSFHTYATAIDVNWGDNAMYASHDGGQFVLPPATAGIAKKYGCEWGGTWTYPQDWMHLEVHLSPADARGVKRIVAAVRRALTIRAKYPLKGGEVFGPLADPSPGVHGGLTELERDYVRLIKSRFAEFGYASTGALAKDGNGVWGPYTTAACKLFQKRHGYTANGHLGPRGYRKLMSTSVRKAAGK